MRRVLAFARFWKDFVLGDDWVVAAAVAAAIALTAVLARTKGIDAWWVMPPAVVVVLALSLVRASKT